MKIIQEFKEFAIKGNMFDMAVGVIIGVAFNEIVSSLVDDIIMPFLSLLTGKVNFENLSFVLRPEEIDAAGNIVQELIVVGYGNFIQVIIDFLIIAFTVFVVIRFFNRLRRKGEDEKDTSVSTPRDIELLSEIRDLLKEAK